jgi:hypothetical protein
MPMMARLVRCQAHQPAVGALPLVSESMQSVIRKFGPCSDILPRVDFGDGMVAAERVRLEASGTRV